GTPNLLRASARLTGVQALPGASDPHHPSARLTGVEALPGAPDPHHPSARLTGVQALPGAPELPLRFPPLASVRYEAALPSRCPSPFARVGTDRPMPRTARI